MLDKLAPIAGKGWGCVQCGLPMDGATVVVCDRCLRQKRPYEFAVSGYPKDDVRVPIETLQGTFEHRMEMHPEAAP
jgi:hypothetical protein